ncbi:MAG TPA: peptidylprolyl isomerase [Candidatus Dormibacteraeota bacterium]|nr:peptidylprolyl isomerase [Candidatus Dormibacteraeota bacterium]
MSESTDTGLPGPPSKPGREIWRLFVVLGVVAVLIVAGLGLGKAAGNVGPLPAPLAKCHPARQLAPRLYAARPGNCVDINQVYVATINTTAGQVKIDLQPSAAPITVSNFIVLAQSGYFNGLPFWEKNSWEIMNGDPRADGFGGPGYTLPDEEVSYDWPSGSVGMADIPGKGISGSQFFITTAAWPGSGPGNTPYNFFASVEAGSTTLIGSLTTSDRILDIEISIAPQPSPAPSDTSSPSPTDTSTPTTTYTPSPVPSA